jgi:hypothetical protein
MVFLHLQLKLLVHKYHAILIKRKEAESKNEQLKGSCYIFTLIVKHETFITPF